MLPTVSSSGGIPVVAGEKHLVADVNASRELTPFEVVPIWIRIAPWAAGLVAAVGGYITGGGVSDWNITHWLFTYDVEFTRRGLVGTLLWGIFTPAPNLVRWLGVGLLIGSSAALTSFAVWCLRNRPAAIRIGFATVTVVCPATLAQFGYDCGRFDQLNLILFLAALVAIERGAASGPLAVSLLMVVALLVHEAFFIIHVPVLVSLMIHRSGGRVHRGWILVAAVALLVTAVVIRYGALEAVDHEAYRNELVERHNLSERSVYNSSRVLYRELPDNIALATRTLPRRLLQWRSAAIAVLLAPWLWVALVTLRALHAKTNPGRRPGFWLPVIAAACPLLLAFVGSDLFRWGTLGVLNLFVVALFLMRMHSEAGIGFRLSWQRITMVAALGLLTGPVGVDTPFPPRRVCPNTGKGGVGAPAGNLAAPTRSAPPGSVVQGLCQRDRGDASPNGRRSRPATTLRVARPICRRSATSGGCSSCSPRKASGPTEYDSIEPPVTARQFNSWRRISAEEFW
jgi:hypothetical protein